MRKFILSLVILAGLLAVINSFGQSTVVSTNPVEQTGYFKSPNRDRVMAFYSNQKLGEEDVRTVIEKQTQTKGALFRAVFISGTIEPLRDGLTLAPDLQKAMQVTAEHDNFDWMVMINPAGDMTIKKF